MTIQEYLDKMKTFYHSLMLCIEEKENKDQNIEEFFKLLKEFKITENENDFKTFLKLIIQIVNDYHRSTNFFNIIFQILLSIKDDIKKSFSNQQIFDIFVKNKRLLLFLLDEKIINLDKSIINQLSQKKYKPFKYFKYFEDEILDYLYSFVDYDEIDKYLAEFEDFDSFLNQSNEDDRENFSEKRKIGENPKYICQLIRNDSIIDFITYINKTNYSINGIINQSIYETNSFLLKNKPSLIEYAAFYGSIQIFNYLRQNNAKIESSLWIYAIHGSNPEIIQYLVDFNVKPPKDSYFECEKEAIKCHHNKIVEYIRNNFLNDENNNNIHQILKSLNFEYIEEDCINQSSFYYFVKYDYFYIVKLIMNNINQLKTDAECVNKESVQHLSSSYDIDLNFIYIFILNLLIQLMNDSILI